MRDAGIIGFVPRGQYSDSETYDFLNFVYYGDSTYVAKKVTVGNFPEENNEFWQLLAKGKVSSVTGVKGSQEEKFRDGDVNLTAQDVGALPVSGGTLESNVEPQLSLKRRSQNFSSLLNFENESRKLIQAKGGLENNDPERESYFSLYDLDADKNGEGRLLELLHVSQNLRNIYDSVSKSMKKILVDGEALPSTGGTIQANASPLLILHRQGQYASMDFENNFGKLIRVGVTKGSETAKPEFHVADVENGTDNAKYLFIISQDKRKIYDKNTGSVQDIVTSNDLRKALQFQPGEIFTIKQSTHFAGYCGADGTTVFFTIPLCKNAEERNINISGRFWIREGGSYLVDAALIQDFSVNIIASGNLLAIDIKKQDSGKFTSKNNVVVMVSGGFTISFS